MPCIPFRSADGTISGFACTRGPRKRCKCGRPATRLCDWQLSGPKAGKTCDAPLCDRCAARVGPGRDYCQAHARMADGKERES